MQRLRERIMSISHIQYIYVNYLAYILIYKRERDKKKEIMWRNNSLRSLMEGLLPFLYEESVCSY